MEQTLESDFLAKSAMWPASVFRLGYPTDVSVPHSVISGHKQVLAWSVETEYTCPLAKMVKAFVDDPSTFVAAAPVAAAPAKAEAKE
jgi:large subunit ribosomal protein LP0